MPHGLNMTAANVDLMNEFLRTAVHKGLDEAMRLYQERLAPDELAVLEKLEADELNSLLRISESILTYRDEQR